MNAVIISIGDELVSGQTVDTNAAWLARQLASLGIRCPKHLTVADALAPIRDAIAASCREAEVVLITGGLGPTPDDLTREALSDALGTELVFDPRSFERIEAYFRQRKRRMHADNRRQAMIPGSAKPIENTCGTAPGICAGLHDADVFCLPGVPYEMREMFERSVGPKLAAVGAGRVIRHRVLRTMGMSESEVGKKLADLMRRDRNPTVGTGATELVIAIRMTAISENSEDAERLLQADAAEARRRLGDVVFGEGEETPADAVARLLIERGATISTAESCTGGLIAKRLTDVPGSSGYMMQGFVTYSNEAKCKLLGIPEGLIEAHGAVSREIAEAMAANCRRISGTDYALSATGIAGPGGATAEKPVGLVFVGLATREGTTAKELRLGENLSRAQVRARTAKIGLNLLRLDILRST